MPFGGPIQELSLFDLFQLLSLSQKTGTLGVRTNGDEIKIFFRGGKIIALKKRDIVRGKKEAQEIIFGILNATQGNFSFGDGEIPVDLTEDFSLKVDNVILEASRRIDELAKIKQKLPSTDTVLMLSPKASDANNLDLTTLDWEIISYVDGIRNVGDIIEILGNEYDTKKHVYGLMKAGLLTAVEGISEEDRSELPKGPKQILLDTASEFFLNGNFEVSKSIYEKYLKLYPEDREALFNLALSMIRTGNIVEAKKITGELLLSANDSYHGNIEELDSALNSLLRFIE